MALDYLTRRVTTNCVSLRLGTPEKRAVMENAPLGTCIVVMLDFPHEASDRQVPVPEMRM